MRYLDLDISAPVRFSSCGQLIINEPWTHAHRTLDSHVLLVAQEGTLFIEQSGIQYEMRPGEAMILFAGEPHGGYRSCEPGLSYYWCHFTAPGISKPLLDKETAIPRMESLSKKPQAASHADHILCPEFLQSENQFRLIIQMRQLLHIANSDSHTHFAADYCLTGLLIEMARQHVDRCQGEETTEKRPDPGQSKRFVEVLEWIRVHRFDSMTASGVAERFGYNADYLSFLFKQIKGVSLIKYIHNIKISEAREKLLTTDISIRQLSYALGFKDEKYFIKLFRLYEGMTPGKYRTAYIKTHTNRQ